MQVTAKLIILYLKMQVNWFVLDAVLPKVRSTYQKNRNKKGVKNKKLSTSTQSNFNWDLLKEYTSR